MFSKAGCKPGWRGIFSLDLRPAVWCSCHLRRGVGFIVIIIRAGGGAGNQGNPLGAYDLVASTTSQLSLRQLGKDNASGVISPL